MEFRDKLKVIHTYLLRSDCFAPFNISLTSSAIFHPFQFMDLLLVVERESKIGNMHLNLPKPIFYCVQ